MASSSQAATCNGGEVSSTISRAEKALWNRMVLVGMKIKDDRATGTQVQEAMSNWLPQAWSSFGADRDVVELQILIGKLLQKATSSKDCSAIFKSIDLETSLNTVFIYLEDHQADSILSSPQICFFLNNLLVSDKQRNWESRFLKLFWRYSTGISDADLLLFLSKLAEHYLTSDEVENLEEFMLTHEERAKFLYDCSTADKASRVAEDFNESSVRPTQGLCQDQKPKCWTRREHTLHSMSSSESVKPLEVIFPFSTRFETAKECLDRLDLLKSFTVDLNPNESDTLASVLGTFKSPELQALHALKKEMELHGEVVLQLEQLSGKHQHALETSRKDQHERQDEFFGTCQEEKRNVIQEALYKKVKCLASIKKASIRRLSSENLLKGIVQKTGSACKEVEGKLKKAQSSEEVCNKECTLCSLEFSKKRKRACLDPCGHASACIDCATKAWAKKPYCPWCKTSIQKPISIPAQIFF